MQGAGGLTRNRNFWVLMSSLAALFFAGLALFIMLYKWGAPRVNLPGAVGITEERPTFKTALTGVQRPFSVATSPDGKRVYVAEGGGEHVIRILDRNGQERGTAVPPDTSVFSRRPRSVAVGLDGTVYAVDGMQNKVLKFDRDGQYLGELAPPDDTRWSPLGLAVDDGGNLYVAEALDLPEIVRHRVLVFDAEGRFLRAFGAKGSDPAALNFPHAVAVDSQGRIYVATMDGVKGFDGQGTFLFVLSGGGRAAPGLAMGVAIRKDELFVVDTTNHRVLVYDVSGDRPSDPFTFGEYGVDSGQLRFPQDVWLSADGRIYVADRANDRVSVWSY